MSNSKRKTKIFGDAGSSEKDDKRINNRMFRRKENIISGEIEKCIPKGEPTYITEYIMHNSNEHTNIELMFPTNMNEVRNVWSMSKDGKSFWKNAPEKAMRK